MNTTGVQRCVAAAIGFVALMGLAFGGDWYVDAAAGSDANGGTAPGDAWRTLTHALQAVPVPPSGTTETVHVAAGVHDAALGEVFPLVLPPGFQVIGVEGATVIDGGGTANVLWSIFADSSAQMTPIGPETRLEGLVLRDAAFGVGVSSDWFPCEPSLARLEIRNMTTFGLSVATGSAWGAGVATASCERLTIEGCGVGVRVAESTDFGDAQVLMTDSTIRGSTQTNVEVWGNANTAGVELVRCRVEGGAGDGIWGRCINRASAGIVLVDSLVTDHAGHGIDLHGENLYGGAAFVHLVRSTVANNSGSGVRSELQMGGGVWLLSSILYGNGDDVEDPIGGTTYLARCCDVGDGDFLGQDGCFSADPLFADPANGDWRLRFGSSCVDAGDPADLDPAAPDLAGLARPVDGDLDAMRRLDVGAHELATLVQAAPAHPGGAIALDLLGPAGGSARLLGARGPLPPPPPFSHPLRLDLPRATAVDFGTVSLSPWPPAHASFPLANDPSLLGSTFSFQAIVTPAHAPLPWAPSSAVEIEVVAGP